MVRDQGRILDAHCAEIGRDPAEIERAVQLLVTTKQASTAAGQPTLPHILDAAAARGTIRELVDAGVTQIVLAPVDATGDRPVRRLADEIVEPVLSELPTTVAG
jgi:hypothetical protein